MNPILKAHIALNVADLERSVDFYERLLGIQPAKLKDGYAKFDVQNPPLNLTLNAGKTKEGSQALSHLGLQVAGTEDVIAIRERWATAGLKPRSEMQTTCCYALQDKAWVTDPDGNEWEAFTVLADVDENDGGNCCNNPALVSISL